MYTDRYCQNHGRTSEQSNEGARGMQTVSKMQHASTIPVSELVLLASSKLLRHGLCDLTYIGQNNENQNGKAGNCGSPAQGVCRTLYIRRTYRCAFKCASHMLARSQQRVSEPLIAVILIQSAPATFHWTADKAQMLAHLLGMRCKHIP
eukprot:1160381-Pelagomonas_calceolata.AAC.13